MKTITVHRLSLKFDYNEKAGVPPDRAVDEMVIQINARFLKHGPLGNPELFATRDEIEIEVNPQEDDDQQNLWCIGTNDGRFVRGALLPTLTTEKRHAYTYASKKAAEQKLPECCAAFKHSGALALAVLPWRENE